MRRPSTTSFSWISAPLVPIIIPPPNSPQRPSTSYSTMSPHNQMKASATTSAGWYSQGTLARPSLIKSNPTSGQGITSFSTNMYPSNSTTSASPSRPNYQICRVLGSQIPTCGPLNHRQGDGPPSANFPQNGMDKTKVIPPN